MSAVGATPRYVVLDGSDGCGKSTQAVKLTERLRAAGLAVDHVREPGSTRFGERIREILLDPATGELDPLSEVLAFSAARRELLRSAIAPALAAGRWVVSERCFASTWVYQCVAAGRDDLGAAFRRVTEDVHRELRPDLLLVLDLDDHARETRLRAAGAPDRIEARGAEFQARVRRGFVDLATPGHWVAGFLAGRVRIAEAGGPADEVADRVWALAGPAAAVYREVRS